MHYILNYVSCSKLYGSKDGLRVLKYYDSQYLFANVFHVFLVYYLPGNENYRNIFVVCFLSSVLVFPCIFLFPKVMAKEEK